MVLGDARPPQLAASVAQEGMPWGLSGPPMTRVGCNHDPPVFDVSRERLPKCSFVWYMATPVSDLDGTGLSSIAWHKLHPMKKPRVIVRTAPETHSLTADTH